MVCIDIQLFIHPVVTGARDEGDECTAFGPKNLIRSGRCGLFKTRMDHQSRAFQFPQNSIICILYIEMYKNANDAIRYRGNL